MTPPDAFSTCKLVLKQISLDDLADDGRAAMAASFSGFTGAPSEDHVRRGAALWDKRFGRLGVARDADTSVPRRFAGDLTLGRGRYFTLCKTADGNDEGVLVRELSTYHNPLEAGLVTIIDPTLPEHRGSIPLALRAVPLRDLLLLCPPIGDRPHPFAARFSVEAKPLYVVLPMRIVELEIDRVVDLRTPRTADWFASALSSLDWRDFLPDPTSPNALENSRQGFHVSGYRPDGYDPDKTPTRTGFAAFPFKPTVESLGNLLPSLLCPSIGGGRGAAEIVGLWLRKLGANGVIFPSARSDSRVVVRNGELVDWSGFNFVDYRDAPAPGYLGAIDFSVGWPNKIQTWPDDWTEGEQPVVYDTVAIDFTSAGDEKGSWADAHSRALLVCLARLASRQSVRTR